MLLESRNLQSSAAPAPFILFSKNYTKNRRNNQHVKNLKLFCKVKNAINGNGSSFQKKETSSARKIPLSLGTIWWAEKLQFASSLTSIYSDH